MYTDYLKTQLTEIEALESEIARIRADCPKTAHGLPDYVSLYVTMESLVRQAAGRASLALRLTTAHIVPAEAEAQRLVSILEDLDVDLDEETLATLELICKRTWSGPPHIRETSLYRSERDSIGNMINRTIRQVQQDERDNEHDAATDALVSAGFVHNEENDAFERSDARVIVTLVNGRESRYSWEFIEITRPFSEGFLAATEYVRIVDTGKSGEFSRLLALIAKPAPTDALAPDSEPRRAIQ